jgi:hypothetical protein
MELAWTAALSSGAIAFVLVIVVVGLRTSARTSTRRIAGTIAVVAIAIPRGGVGRVAHAARGHFARLPARDANGGALPVGTPVIVLALERGVASVVPLPPDIEEAFQ